MQKQIEIEYIAQQKKDKTKILVSSTIKNEKFSRAFESEGEAINYIKPFKKGDKVYITSHVEQVGNYENNIIDHISLNKPEGYVESSSKGATYGGTPNFNPKPKPKLEDLSALFKLCWVEAGTIHSEDKEVQYKIAYSLFSRLD